MNTRFPAGLMLFASLAAEGGARPAPPLPEAQVATVRKEVFRVTRAWIQANERADAAGALALYAAAPEFPLMFADSEGRLMDLEGLRKSARESFDAAASFRVIVHREATTVLGPTTALWVFEGAWEGTLKNGAKLKADACTVTLLLKRFDKDWRIVYQHESYPPPITLKPPDPTEKGM